MNIEKIKGILKGFAQNTIGFQGAALVNSQGHSITNIGLDENATLSMAGTMLYLAERTQKEFGWQEFEQIDIQGADGYVILAVCNPDVFLLVKTSKVPKGMLLADLNRTVDKLKLALKDDDSSYDKDSNDRESQNTESNQGVINNTENSQENTHLPHPQRYRGSDVPNNQ
jgi:predicted regulator of Ras-like GTPase activity (Roadblock/LC7/MglB family)